MGRINGWFNIDRNKIISINNIIILILYFFGWVEEKCCVHHGSKVLFLPREIVALGYAIGRQQFLSGRKSYTLLPRYTNNYLTPRKEKKHKIKPFCNLKFFY